MTIKYPHYPKCGNKGYYRKAEIMPPSVISPIFHPSPTSHDEVEVPCDCPIGRQYQAYLDRRNHPEYRNPFLDMSDDEIFATLDRASKDQQAVDEEFNC